MKQQNVHKNTACYLWTHYQPCEDRDLIRNDAADDHHDEYKRPGVNINVIYRMYVKQSKLL